MFDGPLPSRRRLIAVCYDAPSQKGWHVFVSRKDARETRKVLKEEIPAKLVIKKVKVEHFRLSGDNEIGYGTPVTRGETWNVMTIL